MKDTEELDSLLKGLGKTRDLETVLNDIHEIDFTDYLEQLLQDKNLKKAHVIHDSMLDRNYAYQIFQGKRAAGRDKVIQLGIAMQLNQKEMDRLLTISNNARLYSKNQHDAIIIYALAHHYSVMQTNDLLDEYNLNLLGQEMSKV